MGEPRPRLVADIGGTNARFALQEPGQRPGQPVLLACAAHPDVETAVRAALVRAQAEMPRHAAFAIAAPVLGDWVEMTNHPWRFSREGLRGALGLERLEVINDFSAIALAVPRLRPGERRQVGGGEAVAETPIGVLGPGTGLGVSGLIPTGRGWTALAGEGGHVDFAPGDEREVAILEHLRRRFDHVSLERVLSGPGLVNLYRAHADIEGEAGAEGELPTAEDVTARARAGACRIARLAVETFCAILGSAAGNLALTLGARGGIYIAGGIVPRLGPAFDEQRCRARFLAKGRFEAYLAPIPLYVITAAEPALIGLAGLLDQTVAEQA